MAIAASLSQVYATNPRKCKAARRSNYRYGRRSSLYPESRQGWQDRLAPGCHPRHIRKKRKRRYYVLNLARFRDKSSAKFVKNPNLAAESPKKRVKFKPKFKATFCAKCEFTPPMPDFRRLPNLALGSSYPRRF